MLVESHEDKDSINGLTTYQKNPQTKTIRTSQNMIESQEWNTAKAEWTNEQNHYPVEWDNKPKNKIKPISVPIDRPSWDEYFLSFAILASFRSPDQRTKCGCVLVKDKKIVSVGYNGFPKGVDDDELPNYDKDKYPYVIHAEANAIYNAQECIMGSTAYVSGHPCSECLKALWQCGIKDIVYCEWSKPKVEYDQENRKKILGLLGSDNLRNLCIKKLATPNLVEWVHNHRKSQSQLVSIGDIEVAQPKKDPWDEIKKGLGTNKPPGGVDWETMIVRHPLSDGFIAYSD